MMIEEFVAEFEKFNEFEAIGELTDNAKATLFGVYCQMVSQKAQPKAQPQKIQAKATGRIRKPHASATQKQIGFIEKLVGEGRLDEDIDVDSLTRQAASDLIEEGLKRKKHTRRPTPDVVESNEEDEDEQDPGGAFNHLTGTLFATHN